MAVGKTCTNRGNWLTGKQQRRWDATCCQAHSVSEGGKKCFSWFTLKSDYIFICSYNQCKILRWWSIETWDLHFINAKVYGGNKVGSEVINEGWISGVQKFCFLKQKDVLYLLVHADRGSNTASSALCRRIWVPSRKKCQKEHGTSKLEIPCSILLSVSLRCTSVQHRNADFY